MKMTSLSRAALGCALAFCACSPAATSTPLPNGDCVAETRTMPDEGGNHVAVGTPLSFLSNPPSSGTHYPLWGRWGEHSEVLHRGHYVHNLEHGGVALLYRCEGSCPETVAALRAVLESVPTDSSCRSPVKSRIVLTADPLLDTPIAAAAWTQIYKADCVNGPSLLAFINANYDRAPESLCGEGQVP